MGTIAWNSACSTVKKSPLDPLRLSPFLFRLSVRDSDYAADKVVVSIMEAFDLMIRFPYS